MIDTDIAVLGAGPAGLSAAIEAARGGARVLLLDENERPGGQLFKQIHKFFGSEEHKAGNRGMDIGAELLEETRKLGIEVMLDTEVCGIYDQHQLWAVREKKESFCVLANRIIIATGAMENAISFKGWSVPGVMGAGAAQTLMNVQRVLPGKKVLMVGSGNVGVIVSYQLLQAGAEVEAVVEAASSLGGYGVHTAKIRRMGVPFYTSHTILEAVGKERVEGAVIAALDDKWEPIKGTEKYLAVDTVCLATGLTPLTELAWAAGCSFMYVPSLGGHVPWHDKRMETSVKGIYAAGDITGVEEASTAMEEGKIAGINAAASLGCISEAECRERTEMLWQRVNALRCGPYGIGRRDAKDKILESGGGWYVQQKGRA